MDLPHDRAHRPGPLVGAGAAAAAGLAFLAYPILRPYAEDGTPAAAHGFASDAWVTAHLCAMAGFMLLVPAVMALGAVVGRGPGSGAARLAVVATTAGVGFILPYYGAETFALHALGDRVLRTGDVGLLDLAEAIRMGPTQITMFGIGLLLMATGTVAAAVAASRSAALPRASLVPLAAGMVAFLPQFFAAPWVRVAHGMLVAVGCAVLAIALIRVRSDRVPAAP